MKRFQEDSLGNPYEFSIDAPVGVDKTSYILEETNNENVEFIEQAHKALEQLYQKTTRREKVSRTTRKLRSWE